MIYNFETDKALGLSEVGGKATGKVYMPKLDIKDGNLVEVDGDNGIVRIVEEK